MPNVLLKYSNMRSRPRQLIAYSPTGRGASVSFEEVVLVGEGDNLKVGTPLVSGAKVKATVLAHGRGDKVKIFKLRRRKHYQKTQGHRQSFTEVRVDDIVQG